MEERSKVQNFSAAGKGVEEIWKAFRQVPVGTTAQTITPDNGSEFAECGEIERDAGANTRFTELHSSRQRGTNENTNGLLRFYFPKGTDLRIVTDEWVKEVVNLLNHRLRKYLEWLSPQKFSLKYCA
jgi:IS30 family transposase